MMIVVLLIGTFCTVLNQTILATANPTIMDAFNINTATVQWLTTGFMLVNGIIIPISAWLSTRFNTKWLYVSAMTVFFVGTVIAYVSPNFGWLLTGRLIQAVGVGVTMPLLQTIMLSIFPPERRGTAMGLAGIVIGLAPAIGPTLSGWVIDTWTWRDLFGMIIPVLVLVLIGALIFMRPVLPTKKESISVLSVILSTIGFGSLLYGFSSVGNDGWGSAKVIGFLAVGVIFVGIFVYQQLHMEKPFLEFRVYRSIPFAVSAILSSVSMMAMVGAEMIIPLYLQIVKGMSAFHSGLTLLAGALMMGVMSPITGRAVDRYGARRLSIMGMLLLTIGSVPFIWITKDTPTAYIVLLYGVRMFGIAMAMMPATTVGMNALPVHLIGHGTAVNNTQRQIASSVGTAILTSVLTNVTTSHKPAHHLLTSNPLQYKDSYINATLTGYHAAFIIAALFCVGALITAFFMKNRGQASDYPAETQSTKVGDNQ
ncbi:EmrB QacA subfamily drug resistance transporter [Secundilactobacillus odoratitofui DSM 19909 = JCM 15043]|uniref:EmrB QacA subfamily drug resistance transporter n=2 Tax=Secundilactobacillus odoratitofui TaxID=480930 RepID=A0A0R1M045_9LACO|nr:EmrB QacA subfamily drug resistance transporter [Secundilactobacillus odoratitofui DSM 19909 = JCM 15043]